MAEFVRTLDDTVIRGLQAQKLYTDFLLPDIQNGEVFPAIRNNRIDFYHKGGRLFTFDSDGFKTHVKYASVLPGVHKDYVAAKDLEEQIGPIEFANKEVYERMKENCWLYSGEEAEGVSCLYHRSSYASCQDKVVVLDLEICLSGDERSDTGAPGKLQNMRRRKVDRIDFVLYHKEKEEGSLRFYEAKCFGNKELWSTGHDLESQLERYDKQIEDKEKEDEIIKAYGEYIRIANELFGTKLAPPNHVDKPVRLFVFGFDDSQKKRLQESLQDRLKLAWCKDRCRYRGSPETTAHNIWKKV